MMMLAAHRRFGAEAKQKQRVTFRSNCFATNISNTNGLHALPGTPLGIHPFSGAHMDLARTTARAQKEERRILQAYGYGFTAEGTALVERCFNQLPAYIKETLRRQPRSHSLSESLWLVLKELDADKLAVAVLTAFVHSIWLRDPEERSPSLKSQLSIGQSIRRECLHRELLQSDRELLKKATKAAKRYPDVRRREREVERMLTAAGFRVREWSEHQLVEAGNWGMESVVAALPTV